MNTRKHIIVTALVLLIGALALSACFPGVPRIADPITTSAIHTAAAATIAAEATISAGNTAVAQLTQLAQSPSQPPASSTPLAPSATVVTPATATQVPPSATATLFIPTATATFVIPTPVPPTQVPPIYIPPLPPPPTPVPWYPTPVPLACDWVQFVSDVSVPDNTRLTAGQSFTKTWRLRNIGACTWTPQYALVFVNGDRMQAPAVIPLNRNVRPGETVDLSVNLVAPGAPGDYRGNWMLSNQYGYEFGIGSDARKAFWVDIIVQAVSSRYPYDFTANVCNATWRSSSRVLPCPGNSESEAGSVVVLTDPTLENGRHENEPAIWTRPHASRGGMIAGWYPAYRVQDGDRFLADIGCLVDSRSCDVTFYLDYEVRGQPTRNLSSWHEVYDRQLTRAEVDLSSLAGQSVTFILRVENNGGAAAAANAIWLGPSIRRSGGGQPIPPEDNIPVRAARQVLANALGIETSRITTVSVEPAYWPDTCLGIPQPGIMCAQVQVYGFRVILTAQGRFYEVRTDQNAATVYWKRLE